MHKDFGLLVNYGPALLESMSEADLAAIPEGIQKSFAAILEYTETERQKLLKVVWDSGASLSISNERSDFVGPLDEAPTGHLRCLADGIRIEGISHVAWTFLDCQGMLRTLKLPAYYAPTAGIRLLSMSSLLQEYPNKFLHTDRTGVLLSGTFGAPVGGQRATNGVQATLDPQTNLPVVNALDYDGSRRPRASENASNSSNRRHGDSNSSAGSSGASSPYGSQRGSSYQRGSASHRSRSESSSRRGLRGNDRGTSKCLAGWRDPNDRSNSYTQA
jgi:hypothetical protein